MRSRPRFLIVLLLLASLLLPATAEADVQGAAQRLDNLRDRPERLRQFLLGMPKGTDLHTHLSGAVYGEAMIRWGAKDGKCVDTVTYASSFPPCTGSQVPLSAALTNTQLWDQILAAWSMRGFRPDAFSGHNHFFATFDLFGSAFSGRQGDGLAQVTQRAASQNVQYIEPLVTPQFSATLAIANQVGYIPDFGAMRQAMLNAGITNAIPAAGTQATAALSRRSDLLACGTKDAKPGCGVLVNFDVQILRNQPPNVVFAQLLFGFELMAADPNWAGMNMVQPEDAAYSTSDYSLHMKMVKYLSSVYPDGNVTLHAGELVPGIVPPSDLRFHIREAVNIAGADRIGHGADLRWERNPDQILSSMKNRGTCLEANLTSNEQILELSGRRHPITDYVRAGVKVTLSTDDEGISRTDLTSQYVKAVRQHGFGYRRLKQFATDGLRCSFLAPGAKKSALADQAERFREFEARFPSR
jgi:adenosine deaminase